MLLFAANPFDVFFPIIDAVANIIRFLRDHTGGNLGVAIILFTIAIKSLLAPLTFKSIRSSKAMQDIAPMMKELQKKYKDDRARFAEEQMKLYNQYGVNPLSGCLPVLIQLPVFLIVYNAMRDVATNDAVGVQFLWVADLTKNIGTVLPNGSTVDPLRILVFLAFIFQIIQTRMSQPNRAKRMQQDQQTRTQSLLITASTSLVLFFGWQFIAAMVMYWAVQAVFSAVQQYFITGWGAWSDIFPFLPVKEEKVRELKPVTNAKPPGRFQRYMQQGLAAEQAKRDGQETVETTAESVATKARQPLGPDGRPRKGSTMSISSTATSTPPQRTKTQGVGTAGAPGKAKGSGVGSSAKAVGVSETKTAPPVPRKSANTVRRSAGGESSSGGDA